MPGQTPLEAPIPPLPVQMLPTTREEMDRLGYRQLDVLLVTGDAYIDHPSFGAALIGRWLQAHGYRVGVVAQPRWTDPGDVARLGRPRLFAGVTAGALDSQLALYTAFRKKRQDDAYTPGGRSGARPGRASLVYAGLVRQAFPRLPVVLGGIEASLRRASHYDFWGDEIRRSLLLDAKASLIAYGMAEATVLELARRLEAALEQSGDPSEPDLGASGGRPPAAWVGVSGTAFVGDLQLLPAGAEALQLPSHEEILADVKQLMRATLLLEEQVHRGNCWAVQAVGGRQVVFAPPAPPTSEAELDAVYALPFTRRAHPSYREPIPALEMIRFSVTSHRGCGGACAFCSLALHQGRLISSRSRGSILAEVSRLAVHEEFRGSITDVGGPTANLWGAVCTAEPGRCRRRSCLTPRICPRLRTDQQGYLRLLAEVAESPGVRHVRVASGIRHDVALQEPRAAQELVEHFVGGQLKLAPEHCSPAVLRLMRKPAFAEFERFVDGFAEVSRRAGREQYVVPYLMSAHPGCTDQDMLELAGWLKQRGWSPRQVQCFVPTPGTVSTAMYAAGIDPEGRPIPVARSDAERLRQHALLTGGNRAEGAGAGSAELSPPRRRSCGSPRSPRPPRRR